MQKLIITGGNKLHGSVPISGAKNAALPLLAACLLTDEELALTNVPDLADIKTMRKLLEQHGVATGGLGIGDWGLATSNQSLIPNPQSLTLCASQVSNLTAPYELVRTMRASVLVLGPLLARFGEAKVSLPGGCAIGTRPIDLHLKALEQLGATIELKDGYVYATSNGRLKGADIQFEKVSVGATENLLMAASLAEGTTILHNAAREPEVTDLARCLIAMGARIVGLGTSKLTIEGVDRLNGCEYRVVPDRIEAGSFGCAAAITGGMLELEGISADIMQATIDKWIEAGIDVRETASGVVVDARDRKLKGIDVMTQPYSGFATDMQAQFMAMLTVAEGASMMTETIFENRFMHVPELSRMGANINIHGASAMVRGVPKLSGAEVMATDLRASISLVIAALAAEGQTTVHRIYHLDRGYERMEAKLNACGAQIERVQERVEEAA